MDKALQKGVSKTVIEQRALTSPANEVFGKVRKIVRFRYIVMCEKVLVWILGFIAISQEKLK